MHESTARLLRLQSSGITQDDSCRRPLALSAVALAEGEAWLSGANLAVTSFVALCPGTKQPANQWPLDRFAEIGTRLCRAGMSVVIVGGPGEREVGDRFVEAGSATANAAGKLSVLGSAAVLRRASFMIGLDTGTTHLGVAVGTACVAIYGGKEPRGRWDPVGSRVELIRRWVPCEGCQFQVCPVPGHPCVTLIEVDAVWAAMSPFIDSAEREGQASR
jgi:ADP-heptose:LPS heptosyltransferase